ncbi:MAG TPA: ROK family protein [Gemmataceae bacterium]|nr:ROK family protein [Gemmataceae bacterium]
MRIGVDIGGTKIEVIAIDESGTVQLRHRVPTPPWDYRGTLNAVVDLVSFAEKALEQKGTLGIASPGAISSRTGLIKNSNSTVLNDKPLDRDLAEKLRRPIRLENDANCFALSEAVDGAGAGAHVVFGVILGTGVGGGLVVGKKLIAGRNKIAGEWGHNPLPWAGDRERPGVACYCGKRGCVETFLSGAGLARDYRLRTGKELTAEEIALAVARGDIHASKCLVDYRDRLARSLATIINVLDPDVIVLGGGLSNIPQLYPELPALVGTYTFSDGIDTPILRAAHGDSSGVRGAAWLWDE